MAYLMACSIGLRKIWPSHCHSLITQFKYHYSPLDFRFTHLTTPSTKQIHKPFNLRLRPCAGCALDDNTITAAQRRSPQQQSWSCFFRCPKDYLLPISDGPMRLAKGIATFSQTASYYEHLARRSVRNLSANPNSLPASPILLPLVHRDSTSQQVHDKLSSIYCTTYIINALFPMTLRLA